MKKALVLLPLALLFFACSTTQTGTSNKELADLARDKALSVKADVAAKSDFAAAQAAYDQAAALEAAKDKTADAQYAEAEKKFTAVYEKVKAQRDTAQKELDKAKADIKAVETEAAQLDAALKRGGN